MASTLISGDSTIAASAGAVAQHSLAQRFEAVRAQTEHLCEPLDTEDYVVSSMPDVSPTKWHLAHTSWFFETFVLAHARRRATRRRIRATRSSSTRTTCRRASGTAARSAGSSRGRRCARCSRTARTWTMRCASCSIASAATTQHPAHALVELGLHHEQQHQELLLTDIKHVFWTNPLRPAYRARGRRDARDAVALDVGGRSTRRRASDRARRRRVRVRQRGAAHRVFVERFQLALASRDERRVSRVHGRRRLPAPRALALGRAGDGAGAAVGGAALLGARRRRLDRVHARRHAPASSSTSRCVT